ncbi:hypothetical protein ENSA5_22780 [Enhygromyxa salina]|uniref:ZU5 domain-containing protein n=1 Tax=Enhygromyxa salina TaxID=215803 RepID=A0A2S9YBH8_9BACT|nr:DUF6748 domain-containing protein [Enhygromyxa salina]PRQ02460.1 hypothetical protein ENSA5_22780 [Enhygromyxa salina]
MSVRRTVPILPCAFVPILVAGACTSDPSDESFERAGNLVENFDLPVEEPYFIVTRIDPTDCVLPGCGGWFVKWVGAEQTRCADNSWEPECHMLTLDLSALELSAPAEAALRERITSQKVLVKGELIEVMTKNEFVADTLVVSEILGPTQAQIGPAGGHLEVVDGPIAGLVVEVPPGAVDEPTGFSIQARDTLVLDEVDAAVGLAAELSPHDLSFDKPVTVTMPLTGPIEADNPVMMFKQGQDGAQIALPEDPMDQLNGEIRVRVGQFSIFQPFQRDIDQMVADAESMASCENLSELEAFGDPWAEHLYFYEGMSASGTVFGVQALGGVDAVYDLFHSQIGAYWYVGLGLYTTVLGGAGTYYAGWGYGERDSIQDAWTGNVVGASGDIDILSAFSGFLGLSVGAAAFTSCADLSHLPHIPNNRFCYLEEIQTPWDDAVFGAGGTVGLGINFVPEFGAGISNIGVSDGWWTSWQLYNSLLSGVLSFGGVPHDLVEVSVEAPALSDTATYLQINSPDESELGRGREMARAILLTAATPDMRRPAAELAILRGLARDEGQTVGQYCAPPDSRCISGQLEYWSSNNCISGPASGVAELSRVLDGGGEELIGEIEIGEDGSFCADMSDDEWYRIVQRDQDGSDCWPGYLVECNYWIGPGTGDSGGVCSLDTCEDLGTIAFDCGS